jgi:hypothetical protein
LVSWTLSVRQCGQVWKLSASGPARPWLPFMTDKRHVANENSACESDNAAPAATRSGYVGVYLTLPCDGIEDRGPALAKLQVRAYVAVP